MVSTPTVRATAGLTELPLLLVRSPSRRSGVRSPKALRGKEATTEAPSRAARSGIS